MNVLITGVGFIGKNLARRHLALGDVVIGIDDFSSSAPDCTALARLLRDPGFYLVVGDVRDSGTFGRASTGLAALVEGGKFDIIYNLACPASPGRYMAMPNKTLLTSVLGLQNSVEAMAAFGSPSCRLVHASTSEVYGDPLVHPQPESYWGNVNSFGPRACYDEGKRAAEAMCFNYMVGFGTDIRIARIFNTYGPCMAAVDGRVVSSFIEAALNAKPVEIQGDGEQTRSICYVNDTVNALMRLAVHEGASGDYLLGPVNVGRPAELSINELAQRVTDTVSRITGKPNPGWTHVAPAPDDPRHRCPDITKANTTLAWSPQIDVEEGLERTAHWFIDGSWL